MGERKVLNKYFPPDFDPAKLPKGKRPKDNTMKVRMMLPMSIRCQTCGQYMYKGTKFNTTKEDVAGETYLGIQIFRFYLRCRSCAAEITMKTDPENTDYTMEHGASRNYEPWRAKAKDVNTALAEREEEEKGNAMKQLENRTKDNRMEMDIMSALDEMQSLKARHERVDTDAALAALKRSAVEDEAAGQIDLDEEDEIVLRRMLEQQSSTVRRIKDDAVAASHTAAAVHGNLPSSSSAAAERIPSASAMPSAKAASLKPNAPDTNGRALITSRPKAAAVSIKPKGPQVVVKAKRKADDGPPEAGDSKSAKTDASGQEGGMAEGGLMGLAAYGSDSGSGSGS